MARRYSFQRSRVRFMRRRDPPLWNRIWHCIAHTPLFNPMSRFPMTTRRNFLIRTVATLVGDIAIACAMASACAWLIETAALGLFLSFMVWLIGTLLALAVSQYIVHPGVQFLLSDQKLNDTLAAIGGLSAAASLVGDQAGRQLWSAIKGGLGGLGGFVHRFKPT